VIANRTRMDERETEEPYLPAAAGEHQGAAPFDVERRSGRPFDMERERSVARAA